MRRLVAQGSLALAVIAGCTPTEPSQPLPDGAIAIEAPLEYAIWFERTERCAGLSGRLTTIQFLVIPGVDTFPTDQGQKVGMWTRRGDHHTIILAGNYRNHEMVVRHEMLHSLIGQSGHPDGYFAERCQLTWETWAGS
jgi:hypothetical protein